MWSLSWEILVSEPSNWEVFITSNHIEFSYCNPLHGNFMAFKGIAVHLPRDSVKDAGCLDCVLAKINEEPPFYDMEMQLEEDF